MESIKAREVAPGSWQVWDPEKKVFGKTQSNISVAVYEYQHGGWSCEVHPNVTRIPCLHIETVLGLDGRRTSTS